MNAIVTGSSTGIGRAIAERLGAAGYGVIVNSRADREGGEETASRIVAAGGKAAYVQADVTTEEGVAALMAGARGLQGEVSILVNNAGATRTAVFGEWDRTHWDDMLGTNLISAALTSQAFASQRSKGAIVNIASIRGLEGFSRIGAAAYSAAKAGVINLTTALSRELAPGIRVNSISPGVVRTEYVDRASPELIEQWLEGMAIGRFVEPAEVAEVVLALVTNEAITGSNIVVDGGWTRTRN